jgi:CubicO group peptidase (beta-lactamase class C family)
MTGELHRKIQALLDEMVAKGDERGVQVAVYKDGELVVDAWAGVADVRSGRKVEGESLFPVFSTGKGVLATMIHLLAERGQVGYDKPIAHYWPEFAANGKEGITVRHALAHTAGLPAMPPGTTHATICDWDWMCRAIAAMPAVSGPGEKMAYHPFTFGWLLGEVLQRADGRTVAQFLREEIAGPLEVTTMYFGVPGDLEPEVAILEENLTGPPLAESADPSSSQLGPWMNRRDARMACIPGANGIMNARAVARHYAALLPGGVEGLELLPPKRVLIATEEQFPTGAKEEPVARALGYMIGEGGMPTWFCHPGYGGSNGLADARIGMAFGMTRNLFSPHDLGGKVGALLKEAFE